MGEPTMTRRRDANASRDSVVETEWPGCTELFLADVEKLSALPPEQVHQPLLTLVRARKAIGDAIIACSHARRLYPESKAVQDRLESIAATLREEQKRFPLTFIGTR